MGTVRWHGGEPGNFTQTPIGGGSGGGEFGMKTEMKPGGGGENIRERQELEWQRQFSAAI